MRALLALLTTILFCACASPKVVTRPEGDFANLKLSNHKAYQIELVAADETSLIISKTDHTQVAADMLGPKGKVSNKKLYKVNYSDIENLNVPDYSAFREKVAAMIPLVIIDGLVVSAADAETEYALLYGGLIPLTIFATFTGNPKVSFTPPISPKHLEILKLYCRYPKNLTPEQWQQLLREHQQDDFLTLVP